jgi:hypothetical protein
LLSAFYIVIRHAGSAVYVFASAEFLVMVTTAVFLLWLKVLAIPKFGS